MASEQPQRGSPARFEPLRPVTTGGWVVLWICGPLMWLVGLVIVAYVVRQRSAVGIGLAVFAVSFLLSWLWLTIARRRAVRERSEPPS